MPQLKCNAQELNWTEDLPESDLAAIQAELPGYELLEFVAKGGQGLIIKAVQRTTGRLVAIKILNEREIAKSRHHLRFLREIEILARLNHPHIVTIYDSGKAGGWHYYSMEYVDGVAIDDYLVLERPDTTTLLQLFHKIADALSHAHQQGVIHRDLKPANILVDNAGQPRLVDFGLAKEVEAECFFDGGNHVSEDGEIVGTLPYLSPEQASGQSDLVDVRSDIYSLGVIIYKTITNRLPYPPSESAQALRRNIVHFMPEPMEAVLCSNDYSSSYLWPRIPKDFDRVVLKALAKKQESRYQSAAALSEDIRRVISGEPVFARADSLAYLFKRVFLKYRMQSIVAAAFISLVIFSSGGFLYLWRHAESTARMSMAGVEMGANLRIGSLSRDGGRNDEAIQMFEQALQISDTINSPDRAIMRYTYDAHHRLAELLYKQPDRKQEADGHCQKAIQLAQEMLAAAPNDEEALRLKAFSHLLFGRSRQSRKLWTEASQEFSAAAAIFEGLEQRHSEDMKCRYDTAKAYRLWAECLSQTSHAKDAIAMLIKAEASFTDIVARSPDSMDYSIERARSKAMLGDLYFRYPVFAKSNQTEQTLQSAKEMLLDLLRNATATDRKKDLNQIRRIVEKDLRQYKRAEAVLMLLQYGSV